MTTPAFYTAPRVTCLARPQFELPAHLPVEFRGEATDGERLAEFAGRLCYMSQANASGKTTEQYLANIMHQGHGSVLEHANWSLLLEGVSRSLTHELIRHRAGMAYSELSQRYVDCANHAVVVPPQILGRPALERAFLTDFKAALVQYEWYVDELEERLAAEEPDKVLRRKRAREAARGVLPNATETKILATGNARAWRHVLQLRGAIGADLEFQRLAGALLTTLKQEAPNIFDDFVQCKSGVLTSAYQKV